MKVLSDPQLRDDMKLASWLLSFVFAGLVLAAFDPLGDDDQRYFRTPRRSNTLLRSRRSVKEQQLAKLKWAA